MGRRLPATALGAALVLAGGAQAAVATITFDEPGLPEIYSGLTTELSSYGVTFQGFALHDEGPFGFGAKTTSSNALISFERPVLWLQLDLAALSPIGDYDVLTFDANGDALDHLPFQWPMGTRLSFSFSPGTQTVRVQSAAVNLGIDEMRFEPAPAPTPDPVPEPGAWALMIAGFGLVGAALRRRPVARATA